MAVGGYVCILYSMEAAVGFMMIITAGELPLLEEVTALSIDSGHTVSAYLVEDILEISPTDKIFSGLENIDVIIELHNESADGKHNLLNALNNLVTHETLVMTSAMASSATLAASWTSFPHKAMGFGLIPPLGAGSVVEVVAPLQASKETGEAAVGFFKPIDLVPVTVADGTGLVHPRIVCCLIN